MANIRDLASVIETEARGLEPVVKAAVGHVVLNRMRRNKTAAVRNVWNGFVHVRPPGRESLTIARAILSGASKDTTNGATHFYTPASMPWEGRLTGGRDVGGGLEQVPGIKDERGVPIRTYRPKYAAEFTPIEVKGVSPLVFKFYRTPGNGPVR